MINKLDIDQLLANVRLQVEMSELQEVEERLHRAVQHTIPSIMQRFDEMLVTANDAETLADLSILQSQLLHEMQTIPALRQQATQGRVGLQYFRQGLYQLIHSADMTEQLVNILEKFLDERKQQYSFPKLNSNFTNHFGKVDS